MECRKVGKQVEVRNEDKGRSRGGGRREMIGW